MTVIPHPRASCFLLSHNKGQYAVEAIRSVLDQTLENWELWILENSTDDGATRSIIRQEVPQVLTDLRIIYEEIELEPAQRQSVYVPSWLLNQYYPWARGDYIFYLSDDDLFYPECFEKCVTALDTYQDRHVVWFSLIHANAPAPGATVPVGGIYADSVRGAGCRDGWKIVDCRVDGGQVAYRKSCLDKLDQPWFSESAVGGVASHSDGIFLQRLASHFTFFPIVKPLVIHRFTPKSTWTRC